MEISETESFCNEKVFKISLSMTKKFNGKVHRVEKPFFLQKVSMQLLFYVLENYVASRSNEEAGTLLGKIML